MKFFLTILLLSTWASATVIDVATIHQPLSLHGTDVDGDLEEEGVSLQAGVHSRPMALTGAFPEVLVEAVALPHQLPTNHPDYKIAEVNLVVLSGLRIEAVMHQERGLEVEINVANLLIPLEIDLTARQVIKLTNVAIRKTLASYQTLQKDPLKVTVRIVGTNEQTQSLQDLGCQYEVPAGPVPFPPAAKSTPAVSE
jgi:hypothetical protein